VSWCATCDGFFFRDQDIVVVGGGDTAVEEATFLTRFARSVTMVHRRDTLRASKVMQQRAFSNDKIRFEWDSEVLEAVGTDRLEGVRLRNRVTGEEKLLPATGLFIAVGTTRAPSWSRGRSSWTPTGYVVVRQVHSTATDVARRVRRR
jgi:thioredoxin reductase (NADPH)